MTDIFYSRQTQCPTRCKPNKKVPNYRMKSCQLSIKKSLRTKDYLYPKAVSYTHLDVYKRQGKRHTDLPRHSNELHQVSGRRTTHQYGLSERLSLIHI